MALFCITGYSQKEGSKWLMNAGIYSNPRDTGINVLVKMNFSLNTVNLSTIGGFIGNTGINYRWIINSATNSDGNTQFVSTTDSISNAYFQFIASNNGVPNSPTGTKTTDKNSIIIPLKGLGNNVFYFFKRQFGFTIPFTKLTYSFLDSSLNQGKGGAYFTNKHPEFAKPNDSLYVIGVSGAMHKNGRDLWLLYLDEARIFYSVQISPCGEFGRLKKWVQPTYMKQKLLKNYAGFFDTYLIYPSTTMEFSPQGDYFTHVDDSTGDLFLFHFNNFSGEVKYKQRIDSNLNIPKSKYGVQSGLRELCFSPNGRFIYLTGGGQFNINYNEITQYDLGNLSVSFDPIPKVKSYRFKDQCSIYPAPDGKLYLIYLNGAIGKQNFIGRINQPNLPYPQCELDTHAIPTPANAYIFYGMSGAEVNEFRWPGWKGIQLYIANFTTSSPPCVGKPAVFVPEDTSFAKRITWDFGDGKQDTSFFPTHIYADTGTYQVKMRLHLSCYVDSVIKPIRVGYQKVFTLGNDTTVECYQPILLKVKPDFSQYLWNTNDSTQSVVATAPGLYIVKASDACTVQQDTIRILWKTPIPTPKVYLPGIIAIGDSCISNPIRFSTTSTYRKVDVQHWKWDFGNGDTSTLAAPLYKFNKSGSYTITLKAQKLCNIDSSRRRLTIDPQPVVKLTSDTTLRCGDSLDLVPSQNQYRTYLWQDGSTDSKFKVNQQGKYWVKVSNACGIASDTVNIQLHKVQVPNVFTPNGDGKNDVFAIGNVVPGKGILSVYNRWGERVHFDAQYQNNWSPDVLPTGLYMVEIQTDCERVSSWVQLLR